MEDRSHHHLRSFDGLLRPGPGWDRTGEPRLRDCLRKLTERQRVCVVLILGYDWTLTEVADLLGITIATDQTHANRGLSNLRNGTWSSER